MFGKKQVLRVFESGRGFRWQLFHGKDIVAASVDGFPDSVACKEGWLDAAHMAIDFFAMGQIDTNRFDFRDHPMGGIDWVFRSPEGKPVATSGLPLPDLAQARATAKKFVKGAMQKSKLSVVEQSPG